MDAKEKMRSLGAKPTQAAPGNHKHDGTDSQLISPLSGVSITGATNATAINSIIDALVILGASDDR